LKRFINNKFISNFDFLDLEKLINISWLEVVSGKTINDNIQMLLGQIVILGTKDQKKIFAEENICKHVLTVNQHHQKHFFLSPCIPPARLSSFFIFCTHHHFNDNFIHQFCLFPLYLHSLVVNFWYNLHYICFSLWKAWETWYERLTGWTGWFTSLF